MHPEESNIASHLRASKDKYAYFLLAASASAIAFSITQTKGLALSWSQIPLACSVVLWGVSFFWGCRCITVTHSLLRDSADLYGMENSMEHMPDTKEQVEEMLCESYSENLLLSDSCSNMQFYSLVAGGLFFVGWHITEMVVTTSNVT